MINHLRLTIAVAAATLLAALAWAALSQPGTANAQSSDICDQYPELPECQVEPQPPVGPGGGDGGPATGDGSGDAGGELPFTGYPLSPLLLLLLLLLTVGLTIRAYVAIRQKLSRRPVT